MFHGYSCNDCYKVGMIVWNMIFGSVTDWDSLTDKLSVLLNAGHSWVTPPRHV